MDESSDELLAMLGPKAEYRFFLGQAKSESRRQEYLATRLLLKELIGEETVIDYRSTGAPFLPSLPIHISITHTKGYAALILDTQPTGIDMEYRSNRVLKIRSRFMTPEEEAGIDPTHEVEHLLLHWCAKETLFKRIDQEGVNIQTHLHVNAFPYSDHGYFTMRETRAETPQMYVLAYQVTPEYVLTWIVSSHSPLPDLPSGERL